MKENFLSCPAYNTIQILQEKWVLHIIRALLDGPKGFNELARDVGGCNPTTLAQRLDKLETIGLIDKMVCSVMPPKSSYSLSSSGKELHVVIDAINEWANTHFESTLV